MINNHPTQSKTNIHWLLIFIAVLILSTVLGTRAVHAQSDDESEPKVQELGGIVEPQTISVYRILNLKEGQTLYVRMENATGNLDPFIMLFPEETRPEDIAGELITSINQVLGKTVAKSMYIDPLGNFSSFHICFYRSS